MNSASYFNQHTENPMDSQEITSRFADIDRVLDEIVGKHANMDVEIKNLWKSHGSYRRLDRRIARMEAIEGRSYFHATKPKTVIVDGT